MATPFPKWKVRSSVHLLHRSFLATSMRLQFQEPQKPAIVILWSPRRSISIGPCSAASGAKSWLFPRCLGCHLAPLCAPHSAWQCPCSLHFSSPSEPPRSSLYQFYTAHSPACPSFGLPFVVTVIRLTVGILRLSLLCSLFNPFQLFCDSVCYP